jgi:hypothetical protein
VSAVCGTRNVVAGHCGNDNCAEKLLGC